jgi:hypothetical protein
MTLREPVAVWDLDSTLANTLHRQWMVPLCRSGERSWAEYSDMCLDDELFQDAAALMHLLHEQKVLNLVVSARNESARTNTLTWIRRHRLPVLILRLRPDEIAAVNGSQHEWKAQEILDIHKRFGNVRMVFEDWPETAEVIREITGFPVLVVNPCYPPDPNLPGFYGGAAIGAGN